MSETKQPKRRYRVYVTAYPNIAPAGTTIVKSGIGTNWSVATGRAIDELYADKRLKNKRLIFPIRAVITGESYLEDAASEE